MNNNKTMNQKTSIIFVSGSAGEIDWNLPLLDYLLKKNFNLNIVILSDHAYQSLKKNNRIYSFIKKKEINTFFKGGFINEKLNHCAYLLFRIFIKMKKKNFILIDRLINLFFIIFGFLFSKSLPKNILENNNNLFLFLSEFPSLRKPRDVWIRKKFKNSVFIYHPHSPHTHAANIDDEYLDTTNINYNNKQFLLMGHPLDYKQFQKGIYGKDISDSGLEKIFLGHPKYSDKWIDSIKKKSNFFQDQQSSNNTKDIKILILSRGYGSFFDKDYHVKLVETTSNIIKKFIPSCNVFIKKHPREIDSHWDTITKKNKQFQITNEHMYDVVTNVDFVVTFWTSGAIDCTLMGVPVVEYYNPHKYTKGQIKDNNSYTTVYRKLKIVYEANNEEEFKKVLITLMKKNYKPSFSESHFFFKDIIKRSNNWEMEFNKILVSNNFINR